MQRSAVPPDATCSPAAAPLILLPCCCTPGPGPGPGPARLTIQVADDHRRRAADTAELAAPERVPARRRDGVVAACERRQLVSRGVGGRWRRRARAQEQLAAAASPSGGLSQFPFLSVTTNSASGDAALPPIGMLALSHLPGAEVTCAGAVSGGRGMRCCVTGCARPRRRRERVARAASSGVAEYHLAQREVGPGAPVHGAVQHGARPVAAVEHLHRRARGLLDRQLLSGVCGPGPAAAGEPRAGCLARAARARRGVAHQHVVG